MQSTTQPDAYDDPHTYARLPLEERVLIAARCITAATPFSLVEALYQLAAVYTRAADHTDSTELASHLADSAFVARRLAAGLAAGGLAEASPS